MYNTHYTGSAGVLITHNPYRDRPIFDLAVGLLREEGATGRQTLVYINNKIRMSVCLSVCLSVYYLSTFMGPKVGRHIIYGKKQNLLRMVLVHIRNPSDQPSGRYWPESGRNWKKSFKNALFFKVFG